MFPYFLRLFLVLFIFSCFARAQQGTYLPSQQEKINRERRLPPSIAGNRGRSRSSEDSHNPIRDDGKKLVKKLTRPTSEELAAFPHLFGKADSGAFTFLSGDRCTNKISKNDEKWIRFYETDCLDRTLPGGGMRYSFRTGMYADIPNADLGLEGEWFLGNGLVTQTILLDVGETPLSDISLQSSFVSSLVEFAPGSTLKDAALQSVELSKGLMIGKFLFYKSVKAVPGHTFILRSVAYDGKAIQTYEVNGEKNSFDLLEDDKRKDVIVAFKYQEKDGNNSARIIWKKLRSIDSPKVDIPPAVVPVVIKND